MESIIRFEEAEKALRLDRETLLMLMDLFFAGRDDYVKPLRTAVENRSGVDVRREAHRLKGAAGNLHIDGIGALALEAEKASAKEEWELLERKLEEIESAFTAGQKELSVIKSGA
jgi:HPt (histidine-containing phosphotransfer) domain-containing protein